MATVREVAESLTDICTPVPRAGAGVCDRCHGSPNPGWSTCWSCSNTESQVSAPCELVVPISLYEIPSQLHHELRYYKGAYTGHYKDVATKFTTHAAALAGHFLAQHGACIATAAGGGWDVVTTVPSSGSRQGQHPLVSAINMVPGLRETHETLLGKGSVTVGHNTADDNGFAPLRQLGGERVLLVDDTFTSGARAQSAASAINLSGGTVVAIVPIGRVINPGYGDHVRDYWDGQRKQGFSFDTCCLE